MDYSKSVRDYFELELAVLKSIDVNEINEVMNVLEEARVSGHRIFVCGNGGSAGPSALRHGGRGPR